MEVIIYTTICNNQWSAIREVDNVEFPLKHVTKTSVSFAGKLTKYKDIKRAWNF